jgi:hypothetical protein
MAKASSRPGEKSAARVDGPVKVRKLMTVSAPLEGNSVKNPASGFEAGER